MQYGLDFLIVVRSFLLLHLFRCSPRLKMVKFYCFGMNDNNWSIIILFTIVIDNKGYSTLSFCYTLQNNFQFDRNKPLYKQIVIFLLQLIINFKHEI